MKFKDLEIGEWFAPSKIKLSFNLSYDVKTGEVNESVNDDMDVTPISVTVRPGDNTAPFKDILPGSYIVYGSGIYLRTRGGMMRVYGEDEELLVNPDPEDKLTVIPRIEVTING